MCLLYSIHERRPERNGSIRVVYGARIVHCRPCPLDVQCQESPTTKKPRQVSAILWPIEASSPVLTQPPISPQAPHPVLWGDWPRSCLRRNFICVLHPQTVEITFRSFPPEEGLPTPSDDIQTRAERAHSRLSGQQRQARNACPPSASPLTTTIYGLPASLAQYVQSGFVTAA